MIRASVITVSLRRIEARWLGVRVNPNIPALWYHPHDPNVTTTQVAAITLTPGLSQETAVCICKYSIYIQC